MRLSVLVHDALKQELIAAVAVGNVFPQREERAEEYAVIWAE